MCVRGGIHPWRCTSTSAATHGCHKVTLVHIQLRVALWHSQHHAAKVLCTLVSAGAEWPGSDAMQLEFEASAEPQPELGDIWHDSAEDADWLEGPCSDDGEGAAAPYAGASDEAAAAAFADASSIFHSLYPDGHLTDEARTTLAQQMGVSLSSGMHAYVCCQYCCGWLVHEMQPGL